MIPRHGSTKTGSRKYCPCVPQNSNISNVAALPVHRGCTQPHEPRNGCHPQNALWIIQCVPAEQRGGQIHDSLLLQSQQEYSLKDYLPFQHVVYDTRDIKKLITEDTKENVKDTVCIMFFIDLLFVIKRVVLFVITKEHCKAQHIRSLDIQLFPFSFIMS